MVMPMDRRFAWYWRNWCHALIHIIFNFEWIVLKSSQICSEITSNDILMNLTQRFPPATRVKTALRAPSRCAPLNRTCMWALSFQVIAFILWSIFDRSNVSYPRKRPVKFIYMNDDLRRIPSHFMAATLPRGSFMAAVASGWTCKVNADVGPLHEFKTNGLMICDH